MIQFETLLQQSASVTISEFWNLGIYLVINNLTGTGTGMGQIHSSRLPITLIPRIPELDHITPKHKSLILKNIGGLNCQSKGVPGESPTSSPAR
jgi:hypothetical protein